MPPTMTDQNFLCCFVSELFFLHWSIAQGVLMTPILLTILIPPIILIEFVFMPIHLAHSLVVCVLTDRLGINLKLFAVVILPLSFLALPVLVILLSLIGTTIFGVFSMLVTNISNRATKRSTGGYGWVGAVCCFGFPDLLRMACNAIPDLYNTHLQGISQTLDDFKTLKHGEEQIDIQFLQLVVGVVQGLLSAAVLVAVNGVVGLVKLPFIMMNGFVEFGRCAREFERCGCCGVVFIWVAALVPFGVCIMYAVSLLLSFQWGIFCALRAYSEGSVSAGTDLLVYSIVFYNSASSESMGIDQKGNNTDWPTAYKDAAVELRNQRRRERHREGAAPVMERGEPGERGGGRVHLERQLSNFQGKEGVKMGQIWDNFFEMCAIDIVEGVRRGWVEEDEVASLAPSLLIGAPASVTLHCVLRSLSEFGPQDVPAVGSRCHAVWIRDDGHYTNKRFPGKISSLTGDSCSIEFDDGDVCSNLPLEEVELHKKFRLHGGKVVDGDNRPHNKLANTVYGHMGKMLKMASELALSEDETGMLERAAIRQDVGEWKGDEAKREKVVALASELFSVGIAVSRAPTFHRKFQAVLGKAGVGAGAAEGRLAGDTAV